MPTAAPDVRYVVLSDLHLGEADSVLTELRRGSLEVDLDADAALLRTLVRCVEQVVEGGAGTQRPVLILNGDALELAFGSFDQALTNFARLAQVLMEREVFERIVYLPGNHDHHIWEIARETQYANALLHQPAGEPLPPLAHATSCRPADAVPAYLLNKIFDRARPEAGPAAPEYSVDVIYPNLALIDDAGRRCVLLHHGHYVEPLYHFFSTVRRWLFPDRPHPGTVEEVEEENFAWIEFVWSLMGRSGGAGADMRSLFRMLRNPDEFEAFAEALARRTAAAAAPVRWLPTEYLRRLVLKRVFRWVGPLIAGERTRGGPAYPARLRHGIERYLFGPAIRQLRDVVGQVPDDLSFVFGHTHKPFEALLPNPSGTGEAKVYNTGGWPVDSLEPHPPMGASILFLGAALDVAALRVYNDSADGGTVSLDVRPAEGAAGAAFRDAVQARVRAGRALWSHLAVGIQDAIRERRRRGGILEESLRVSLAEIRAVH